MIGLGPHQMSTMLWVFEIGLVTVLVLLTLLSVSVAVRATRHRPPSDHASAHPAATEGCPARNQR